MMPISDDRFEDQVNFQAAVGQGISTWTYMEGLIVEIAAPLLGSSREKTGLIFYSIMNFNVWLTLVTELFAMSPPLREFATAWNLEAEKLKGLNDTRVRLAHHTTPVSEAVPTLRPHSYDTRPKSRKYKPLTYDEIIQFGLNVLDISERLVRLTDRLERAVAKNVIGPTSALRRISSQPELDLGPPQGTPESR